jgi:molecular chaperone GrpE (heat shock protein)
MTNPDLLGFGVVLTIGLTLVILAIFGSKTESVAQTSDQTMVGSSTITPLSDAAAEVVALKQQCLRLREELQQQKAQLLADFYDTTFDRLQFLLTNYPTAQKMAEAKPDLPARNLTSLFTPLEVLLQDWQIEPIGAPWQQIPYDPQLHQSDEDDITAGELVYIRFVGYRQGNRVFCPAKVSRTLPPIVSSSSS